MHEVRASMKYESKIWFDFPTLLFSLIVLAIYLVLNFLYCSIKVVWMWLKKIDNTEEALRENSLY